MIIELLQAAGLLCLAFVAFIAWGVFAFSSWLTAIFSGPRRVWGIALLNLVGWPSVIVLCLFMVFKAVKIILGLL